MRASGESYARRAGSLARRAAPVALLAITVGSLTPAASGAPASGHSHALRATHAPRLRREGATFSLRSPSGASTTVPISPAAPMMLHTPTSTVSVTALDVPPTAQDGRAAGDAVQFIGIAPGTDRAVAASASGGVETTDTLHDASAPTTLRWRFATSNGAQKLVARPDGGVDVVRLAPMTPSARTKRAASSMKTATARRRAVAAPSTSAARAGMAPGQRTLAPPNAAQPSPVAAPPRVEPCPPVAHLKHAAMVPSAWPATVTADPLARMTAPACVPLPAGGVGMPTYVTASRRGPPAETPDTHAADSQVARPAAGPRGSAEVVVARIQPPTSVDANGTPVPTHLTVDGDVVTMDVATTGATAYPVKADPVITGEDATQPCSSLVQAGTFEGRGVLTRSCAVWFALGFNDYRLMNYAAGLPRPFANSTTVNEGCGPILDSEDQSYELARIKASGANVLRVWFYQKYYQDFINADGGAGHDPWTPYVHLLQAAKNQGLLVIPVLTNDWDQCDREPSTGASAPANDGHHASYTFFGPGPGGATPTYEVAGTYGYTYSAKQWASMVASEFGPSGSHSDLTSTIAFYQLVNEAEIDSSSTDAADCGPNAAQSLAAFGNDMAQTVKAAYAGSTAPLISLGTMGIGQCGVSSSVADPVEHPNQSDYAVIHAPSSIDLCEVHDYDAEAVSDPSFNWYALPYNSLSERLTECGSKPMIIGEAGIEANVQPGDVTRIDHPGSTVPGVDSSTLDRRATYLSNKIATDFNAGVAGYVLWDKIMAGSDTAWNAANDETLGYGAYGTRSSGVKHQDPSLCVMHALATTWQLGALPPSAPSQTDCDATLPVGGAADHYAFVDGTTEGWSTQYTWGYLNAFTATGNAPPGHPTSDSAAHSLALTLNEGDPDDPQYTPAIDVESDSVALLQPGDTVWMWVYRPYGTADVGFAPMLRLGTTWNPCMGGEVHIPAGSWQQLSMTVPTVLDATADGCIGTNGLTDLSVHGVGLWVKDDDTGTTTWGDGQGQTFYLDDVTW